MVVDPAGRMTCDELLDHSYFDHFRDWFKPELEVCVCGVCVCVCVCVCVWVGGWVGGCACAAVYYGWCGGSEHVSNCIHLIL